MMRTLLLLVCMVLGSTFELAGTLQMSCRSRRETAQVTVMAAAENGRSCGFDRACARERHGARSAGHCEWRCGCCRANSPVAISLVRVAPLPMISRIAPPVALLGGWPVRASAQSEVMQVPESPPPRA